MSENWPKILDVIGTAFLKAIVCAFYMHEKGINPSAFSKQNRPKYSGNQ